MTRKEFTRLVKADFRAQLRQTALFVGTIMAFGLISGTLAKRWDDKLIRLDSPELWSLGGMAIITIVLVVIGFRLTGKNLLRCPFCKKT